MIFLQGMSQRTICDCYLWYLKTILTKHLSVEAASWLDIDSFQIIIAISLWYNHMHYCSKALWTAIITDALLNRSYLGYTVVLCFYHLDTISYLSLCLSAFVFLCPFT